MKKFIIILLVFCFKSSLNAQKVTFADKTPIKMQAITNINSASLHIKDTFSVSLFEDIIIEGKLLFTKGSKALATIDAIEPAKTNGRAAKLNILYTIQAPDGTKIYCKSENKGQGSNFAKKSGNFLPQPLMQVLG
jgi:subtilase family serine protease